MPNQLNIPNFDAIKTEYFIIDVVVRATDGCVVLYVPKDKISENAKKGFVSLKQLDNLRSKLKNEYDVDSEWILIDSDSLVKMSESFQSLLKIKFHNIIDIVYISFLNTQKVSVNIKLFDFVDNVKKEEVKKFLMTVLNLAEIELQSLQWDEIELPSLIELLIVIKRLQPVTLEKIYSCLSKNHSLLQKKWLNNQLDKLIKKKLLVREQVTGAYIMTAQGLSVLPKVANRNSSDIMRALDLGRRKW